MKNYGKFLGVGFICGMFCMIGYAVRSESMQASNVIGLFGLSEVDYFVQYLSTILYWILPLLIFQIVFGTFVYRHFCTASVYFFSRYPKRTRWFLEEATRLYILCLGYLMMMVLAGIISCVGFSNLIWDSGWWKTLGLYFGIFSLYLFSVTLAINILSMTSNSNVGFIVIEGVNIASIASFSLVGNLYAPEGVVLKEYEWMLKVNPFYYLVYGVRNYGEETLVAMLLFLVIVILLLLAGVAIVNRREFIVDNGEIGGM